MAFLFSSSHLPASRVRRPDLEDDDDNENREALPRSGGVRASSHLEGRVAEPETARSAGGSPAPRSSSAGIDWMARLKELAEQQQQRRRADSAAPDSGPGRADEEHAPDAGAEHEDGAAPGDEHDEAPEREEHDDTSSWYHPPESGSYHTDPGFNVRPEDIGHVSSDPGFNIRSEDIGTASPDTGFYQHLSEIKGEGKPAVQAGRAPSSSPDWRGRQSNRGGGQRSVGPDAPAGSIASRSPVATTSRLFEKRSAPDAYLKRQQRLRAASGPTSQQQVRGANPATQTPGGKPAVQSQAMAQRPAAPPAQNAPEAPQPAAAGGGENQARQYPYKIHESDENSEIVRTADASAPPPRRGAKFGEHARSVINAALENSPTAREVLNKARDLSKKDVVIHSTTATNAEPYIGLDGTIHIFVNPNTLLPGTLAHETAHAIQNWYQQATKRAKRGAAPPTDQELDDAKLRGRNELHGIAPVTYIDPRSEPEDDTSENEPRSKSTENEAMRIANIVNAEISAAKVKAKMEAFKKERPEEFEKMLKDPKKMTESIVQSFWFEQKNIEAISHQTNKHVPMRESTLYGKEGGLKHVLEMLGYGVTEGDIKNAAPIRHRYAPPKPPK